MRNLITFLIKYAYWWLFLLLVLVSVELIVNDNIFQRSIYLSSANKVSGKIYNVSSSLTSYIGLKAVNEDLTNRSAEMEARIQFLEEYIRLKGDSLASNALKDTANFSDYSFLTAKVINNSISQIENYITLNKGSIHGVAPDMGVISPNGVIGVVSLVSKNFSVVIPILNPKFSLSCKIRKTNYFGPLVWDGIDARYAWLNNQPRHVPFNKGDTVVTSGFSAIFPEGIMVGIIEDSKKEKDDNFNSLKVKLSTDFYSLKEVLLVNNKKRKEQHELEGRIK